MTFVEEAEALEMALRLENISLTLRDAALQLNDWAEFDIEPGKDFDGLGH
jgi:hypothetical protein